MIDVILKVKDREWDIMPFLSFWIEAFRDHRIIVWNDSSLPLNDLLPGHVRVVGRNDLLGLTGLGAGEIWQMVTESPLSTSWYQAGFAHLATFYLAESPIFWNIDADDMKFEYPLEPALIRRIEEYVEANEVLAMSWDLHWSFHERYPEHPHHWSFGVTVARKDLEAVKRVFAGTVDPIPRWGVNVDVLFEAAKNSEEILSMLFPNTLIDRGAKASQTYDGGFSRDGRPVRVYKDVVVFDDHGDMQRSWDGLRFKVRNKKRYERDSLPLGRTEHLVDRVLNELGGKDRTFVDVGAFVGGHSVRMSRAYGQVVAIEPVSHNSEVLECNLAGNDCDNVTVINTACGDETGQRKIGLYQSGSTMLRVGKLRLENVPIDRLDNLVSTADVIKIDVEGWEVHVIAGAKRLVADCRPAFVIEHHEFRGYSVGDTVKAVKEILGPEYISFSIDGIHCLHVHESIDPERLKTALLAAWTKHVIEECQAGRPWYGGLCNRWWWGMTPMEFLAELPFRVTEREWLEKWR